MARVTVVGAGVVGLTCAVRLLEEGHRVDVLARDLPLETTSAVAAAIWYPYRAFPFDRVLAWSARTYEAFAGLADVAGTGVMMRRASRCSRHRRTTRGGGPPSRTSTAWRRPPGTATRGPSWRRSSRCPCTSPGWPPDRGAGRHDHPAEPRRAAGRAGRRGQRRRHRRPAARRGPSRSRPVRGQVVYLSQVGLERWYLESARRPRTSCPARTTSWSAAPTRRGSGAGRRRRTPRRRCWRGPAGWCRSWRPRWCFDIGWGCVPLVRRYGWSGSATSCTATATAAPASR